MAEKKESPRFLTKKAFERLLTKAAQPVSKKKTDKPKKA